jgi:hypothetical protein
LFEVVLDISPRVAAIIMRAEEAFVVAISRSRSRARESHDRWIPVDYWIEKLQHVLSELDVFIKRPKPKQLLSKLEKRGYLNREFSLPADKESFGAIKRIHSSHKKLVSVEEQGKEKTIYFLFLETKLEPPAKSTVSMWQGYYDSFLRRRTHQLRVERRSSIEEGRHQPAALTVVTEERGDGEPAPPPRPVTPTVEPIDSDIKALLEPFFDLDLDGVALKASNSGGGNRGLKAAIKAFGCRLQWTDNESVAAVKGDNEDLPAKAVGNFKGFLDRHCCPPRKSCIQAFIALAIMIDKEQPAVDIFQLKKAGGSKGSGTKLVPIIREVE